MSFRDREVAEVQLEADWLRARCACITASNLNRLIEYDPEAGYVPSLLKTGKSKGKRTKKAADYLTDVLAERLTGNATEHYVSLFMDRGRELEGEARRTYEMKHGVEVAAVGFVLHPNINWFGSSPDGVIEEAIGVEFKCPASSTHLEYLLGRCEMFEGVPLEYLPQLDAGMACLGLDEWRFASYHDQFPAHLQLYSAVLKRNEKRLASLEYAVIDALAEIETAIANLPKEVVCAT